MVDTLTKTMTVAEIKEILHDNCIATPYGWEIVLTMLFKQCDYIEIHGYGEKAEFKLVSEWTRVLHNKITKKNTERANHLLGILMSTANTNLYQRICKKCSCVTALAEV